MKKHFIIWLGVTVLVMLYVWAGSVASRSEMVDITLSRGSSTQVRMFRFAEDRLQMRLIFKGDHTRRNELGDWAPQSDGKKPESLKFDNPGAAIRIVASVPGVPPVTYEAMPMTGSGWGSVIRKLTANLSSAPGVWPWTPPEGELVLHPGTNVVNIEVVEVEPPLIGEAVELWVDPALGFKQTAQNVAWLWWSLLLWPVLLAIQLLWAAAIGVRWWKNRSRTEYAPASEQ